MSDGADLANSSQVESNAIVKDRWNLLLGAKAGQPCSFVESTFWNPATISMWWQSRDKESRKNPNTRLNMDVDVSQGPVAVALFSRSIRFLRLFFFLPLVAKYFSKWQHWRISPRREAFTSRNSIGWDIVNFVDLFYATRKLLPLLSLLHEHRLSKLFAGSIREAAL